MNKKIFTFLLVAVLILAVGSWLVFSNKVSRIMLSHGVGMVYRIATRLVVDRLPPGHSQDRALLAVTDYVHLMVATVEENIINDEGPVRILLSGNGYCDQIQDIFIRLIEPLNVRGYMVFLQMKGRPSPHTTSFITPRHLKAEGPLWLMENAWVFDTFEGHAYRTQSGEYATPQQICENKLAPEGLKHHNKYYCKDSEIFISNQPHSQQPALKRWFYEYIFLYIPEDWLRGYLKLAIWLDRDGNESVRARNKVKEALRDDRATQEEFGIASRKTEEVAAKARLSRFTRDNAAKQKTADEKAESLRITEDKSSQNVQKFLASEVKAKSYNNAEQSRQNSKLNDAIAEQGRVQNTHPFRFPGGAEARRLAVHKTTIAVQDARAELKKLGGIEGTKEGTKIVKANQAVIQAKVSKARSEASSLRKEKASTMEKEEVRKSEVRARTRFRDSNSENFTTFNEPGHEEFLLARVEQLFFRFEVAGRKFLEIERKYPNTRWAKHAKYYRMQSAKMMRRFGVTRG